jgi:hypothetical protein
MTMLEPYDHVLEYVDDYWHDVLPLANQAFIEGHCEHCDMCKAALEAARKRHSAFTTVKRDDVSERLIGETLRRVDAAEVAAIKRRRWLYRLGGAVAACVAILAVVHVYFANLTASPYDLTVLGQARLVPGTGGSLRIRVVHHELGNGVQGVPVTIDLVDEKGGRTVHLANFTTDEQGTGSPRFQLPDWPDGDYPLRVSAQAPDSSQMLTRTITLQRAWKLMMSSDRPVYQPGQVIHVRSLVLRRLNLRPLAGQEAIFTIGDPKGNVIFKERQLTSRYGICAVDCPLAEEIIEGTYTIGCQVGETKSSLAVEVKKYVLPRFKVDVTADRPFYQPGQRVRGKLQAHYFFGKPVADAVVEVALDAGGKLKLRTDDCGETSFEFPPLAAEAGREPTRVQLTASVTDSAGQKETRSSAIVVAARPLQIDLIPEGCPLLPGLPNTIYVLVSTADGRPARARVIVSGRDQELNTDELGVASFETTPAAGEVVYQVRAIGQDGESGREFRLPCGPIEYAFLLSTDRAVYNGGDTMHVTALGGDDTPILVDLLKDGQTLLTLTLAMTAGRGDMQIDLPPDVFGTLELYAYRMVGTALPVRQSRVLFVRPPTQLKIATTLDRDEYRPGGRAQLGFVLTGANGEPVPGALSLAAVDEAVFAVSDQISEMEPVQSLLDGTLLQPVLATDQWSPTASAAGGPKERQRLERALFARAANQKHGVDREQFMNRLLPFVENNKRIFDVLKRPDWEKLVPPDFFPAEALAILRNHDPLYSLHCSTYPENVRKAASTRASALHLIHTAWLIVGTAIVVLIVVVATIAAYRVGTVLDVLVVIGLVATTCCLLFPATQKVREASERTTLMNDLKQIALGTHNYLGTHKRFPSHGSRQDGATPAPRVREWFPETLLWRPELITDDAGRASLDLDLADSITTWRLTAGAVTADGRLGAAQTGIKVFQPFFVELNLPVALTRNDEVSVPVVLYNYVDRAQEVELKLEDATWFRLLSDPVQRVKLGPSEVRSAYYRLRVEKVGRHELQVTALSSGVADAVKRAIEVVPDGRRIEKVYNGALNQPADIPLNLPAEAIDGSPRLLVKIAPSSFSQVVEGLDGILRLPHGCFEQTSSTTYPNVLALDYLRRIQRSMPAIEAKARQYIHKGYQRLLGFEVNGGGFEWFGRPPANRTLTAYGLMEFEDMAKVHEVDAGLISRTRKWLLAQRRPDGSWDPEGHVPHNLPGGQDGSSLARLRTTAYIGWAVCRNVTSDQADATRSFLLSHRADSIHDPYTLALVCNALLAVDPDGKDASPYLDCLATLRHTSEDGKLVWWQQGEHARTAFHGSGLAGDVETTALATLALIQAHHSPLATRGALTWLITQKGASGVWPSTQATVLALKALIGGTGQLHGDGERLLELALDRGKPRTIVIPSDQADVIKLIDLTGELTTGSHTLQLRPVGASPATYQVVFRYHQPGDEHRTDDALSIALAYEDRKLRVGDTLQVTARVSNHTQEAAPMVMVELPIPAGFSLEVAELDQLKEMGAIAKYQVQPTRVLIYLRELSAARSLALPYRLRARMAVDIHVPAARIYEYYNPQRQGLSTRTRLTVSALRQEPS